MPSFPGTEIEIDVYRITRIEREEERPEHYDWKPRKYYVFELIAHLFNKAAHTGGFSDVIFRLLW
jgi:hypothetical protein